MWLVLYVTYISYKTERSYFMIFSKPNLFFISFCLNLTKPQQFDNINNSFCRNMSHCVNCLSGNFILKVQPAVEYHVL